MQKEDIKFTDSTVLEGMVSVRSLLAGQKAGICDRKIVKILYDIAKEAKNGKEIAFLRHEGERQGFPVEACDADVLAQMTVGSTHGGIVAVCSDRTLPQLRDKIADLSDHGFYVMIEGIEDPYNFGYAIRSLYALGVDGVILPPRNWMSAAGVVARSSAGASEMMPLYLCDAEECADLFHGRGYSVICADVDTEDTLESTAIPTPVLLIVGGEKRGISRKLKQKSDKTVKITYGRIFDNALSAASATTILAYEIAKQNRKGGETK